MQKNNKRRISITRKEKHLRTKKIYACECGSQYIGFTSLYLHFQKKHNRNISIRRGARNRRIEKLKGKTIYTYYFSLTVPPENESFEEDEISQEKQKKIQKIQIPIPEETKDIIEQIQKILKQFLSTLSPSSFVQSQNSPRAYGIISQFLGYVKSGIWKRWFPPFYELKKEELPYLFNPYINQKCSELRLPIFSYEIQNYCYGVESLGNWLYEKKYASVKMKGLHSKTRQ